MSNAAVGGGAMGMANMMCSGNESLFLPCGIAYAWCVAAWKAYEASPPGICRELAENDLRDAHAVAMCCVEGHVLGELFGSSFVTDNELFKLVAILYLSDLSNRLPGLPLLLSTLSKASPNERFTHCLDSALGQEWRRDLDRTLHTDMVFCMPQQVSSLQRYLRQHEKKLKQLSAEVDSYYLAAYLSSKGNKYKDHTEVASLEYLSARNVDDEDAEDDKSDVENWSRYGFLTVGQALELLQAINVNPLLKALVTKRPPNCQAVSHFMAMLDCTEHARLWLFKSKLPVYYNFPHLTYAQLWDETATSADCDLALKSPLGFGARIPSPVEKFLRRVAYTYNADLDAFQDPSKLVVTEMPKVFQTGNIDFSRLRVTIGYGNDIIKEEPWPQVVRAITLLSKCEPIDKLQYLLLPGASVKEHVSDFAKTAHERYRLPLPFPYGWPVLVDTTI